MTFPRATDPASLEPLLTAARRLAEEAGSRTLKHFGRRVASESKGDGTPVTVADREAESFLRDAISMDFPDHGILGEEFGTRTGAAPVRWILDPIDGTRSFMRGVPLYAVLIGVEVDGEAVIGVAHFPALGETVYAARGLGCFWQHANAESIEHACVSQVDDLADALALTTDSEAALASRIGGGWQRLCDSVSLVRGWGDAYGHILVATGRAETMVDPELAAWDAAPLLPILTESGGTFTDLDGNQTIHGGSGVSSNGRLHADVLECLESS